MKSSRGFTLLEMLIALSILATITLFSTQSIQQALKSKVKIQTQVDDMSRVRDTLRIIERDVNLAFHYRDLEKELLEEAKKANKAQGAPPPGPGAIAAPTPPPAPDEKDFLQPNYFALNPDRKDPTTQFYGSNESLIFPTLNSSRMNADNIQADYIKVGYFLTGCSTLDKEKKSNSISGKCLVRRTANVVEGDIQRESNWNSTVLLEGIQEFKMRYIGKGKQDWVSSWNSKEGDAATKDNFPEAVEVSVAVELGEGNQKRKISMQIVAGVHFPNNKPPAEGQQPGGLQ